MCISERWNSADFTEFHFPARPWTCSAVSIHGVSWFGYQSQHETQIKWLSLTCVVYWILAKLWMSGDFETLSQAQVTWTWSGFKFTREHKGVWLLLLCIQILLCVQTLDYIHCISYFCQQVPVIALCCVPLGYLIFPLGKTLTPLTPCSNFCSETFLLALTHSHEANHKYCFASWGVGLLFTRARQKRD